MGIPAAAINFVKSAVKFVSPELARKGLEKISPKFKSYFSKALSYGFTANQALDFLSDRFSSEGQKQFQQGLAERGAKQQLRPDEMEAQAQIQSSQLPGKVLRTAASLAVPFLAEGEEESPTQESKSPVQQIAGKVTKAVSPVTQASKVTEGLATNVLAGRGAMQAKKAMQSLGKTASIQSPPSGLKPFDLFKKDYPELGRFIEKKIGEGIPPVNAAKRAKPVLSLKKHIERVEEDLGQPFEDVMAQLFNEQEKPEPEQVKQGQTHQALQQLSELMKQYIASKGAR